MSNLAGPKERTVKTAVLSGSLFERLRRDDVQAEPETGDASVRQIASIKASLVRILNGRAGGAASTPAFGLGDLNDASMGTRDLMGVITADIRQTLLAHEPRLKDVTVQFDRRQNGGYELHFLVHAALHVLQGNRNVTPNVTIDLILKEGRHFAAI